MDKAVVRARVDEKLKADATLVLANFGLTVSDAVRMMLARVVQDKTIPLELKVPNNETASAIRASRERTKARQAEVDKDKAAA